MFFALGQTHDIAVNGRAFADIANGSDFERTIAHAEHVVALSIVMGAVDHHHVFGVRRRRRNFRVRLRGSCWLLLVTHESQLGIFEGCR